MKVAILHLSDLHLRATNNNPVSSRVKHIVGAITSAEPVVDACILALTGDIASSGKQEEYLKGLDFITQLEAGLVDAFRIGAVEKVIVPGNHDCNFDVDLELRDSLLPRLIDQIDSVDLNGKTLAEVLSVQEEFFQFRRLVCDAPNTQLDKLCHTKEITIFGHLIQMHCYNTAFLSRKCEEQAKLVFPVHAAQNNIRFSEHAALSISLLHHPANWLESNNETRFTRFLESTSDFILTGHQHHDRAARHTDQSNGQTVVYLAGDALQGKNPGDSGFNVVICDLKESRQRCIHFTWVGQLYMPSGTIVDGPMEKNEAARHNFINNSEYAEFLDEIGTGFVHPRKKELTLQDLYVFPDLRRTTPFRSSSAENSDSVLSGSDLVQHVSETPITLIIGSYQAGKTSLAKVIYRELQKRGKHIPLMIDGAELTSVSESGVLAKVYAAFEGQYSKSLLEHYKQLPTDRRVLIIDDLEKSRLSRKKGYATFLDIARRLFGRIIMLADDVLQFEELASENKGGSGTLDLERFVLLPLNHRQRGHLIEKWHELGEAFTGNEREIALNVRLAEQLVETLIWRDLLPAYPVFVIAVLQSAEARKTNSTASSYGYIYEALITGALFQQTGNAAEVEKRRILFAQVAFKMFSEELRSISRSQIVDVCRQYEREYQIGVDAARFITDAETAQILSSSDDTFWFKYKYSYYYFVGKYFASNLQDKTEGPKLRSRLMEMADYLYYDEYANVLLFALYLTKDTELIRHLTELADQIYADFEPCDLNHHVAFVNSLQPKWEPDILPNSDVKENLDDVRKQKDEAEFPLEYTTEKVKYQKSLDDIVKLNIGFKTLQLLGQVVRDSPSSLKGEIKVDATQSVYLLGLRILRAVLASAEENIAQFRKMFAEVISEHKKFATPAEVANATDRAITNMARGCAYVMIKRISFAVGLEDLEQIYQTVLQNHGTVPSVRLVDLSIKLDHFRHYPEQDIIGLESDLRHNFIGTRLLRDLVVNHMRLVEIDYRTRARIGKLLNINSAAPSIVAAPKRLAAKNEQP